MDKKILSSMVIILIFFDLLLIYTVIEKNSEIELLESQIERDSTMLKSNISISHSSINMPTSGLKLLFFLSDKGCYDCVVDEVVSLNQFYRDHEKFTKVYFIGSETYLKRFQIEFPIEKISTEESIFNKPFELYNPVSVLVDKKGRVQQIYEAEVGNKEKRLKFYQRMNSLLESIE